MDAGQAKMDGALWGKGELMSDPISREAVIDAIFSEPLYKTGMKKRDADAVVPAIYEKIKSLPSAQPEIIRCKECKHWFDIDDGRQKHRMCADLYGDWFYDGCYDPGHVVNYGECGIIKEDLRS